MKKIRCNNSSIKCDYVFGELNIGKFEILEKAYFICPKCRSVNLLEGNHNKLMKIKIEDIEKPARDGHKSF